MQQREVGQPNGFACEAHSAPLRTNRLQALQRGILNR